MPTFDSLWTNYASNKDVTREALYKELGWDSLINNPSCNVVFSGAGRL